MIWNYLHARDWSPNWWLAEIYRKKGMTMDFWQIGDCYSVHLDWTQWAIGFTHLPWRREVGGSFLFGPLRLQYRRASMQADE